MPNSLVTVEIDWLGIRVSITREDRKFYDIVCIRQLEQSLLTKESSDTGGARTKVSRTEQHSSRSKTSHSVRYISSHINHHYSEVFTSPCITRRQPNAHPSSSLPVTDLRLLLELLLLAQRLHLAIVLLGDLAAVQTDLVPGQVEELVDALKAAAGGFGDAEPDPDGAEDGDDTVRKCVSCFCLEFACWF